MSGLLPNGKNRKLHNRKNRRTSINLKWYNLEVEKGQGHNNRRNRAGKFSPKTPMVKFSKSNQNLFSHTSNSHTPKNVLDKNGTTFN